MLREPQLVEPVPGVDDQLRWRRSDRPPAASRRWPLHDLKVALVFLTRLPIRLKGEVALRDLAAAVHFFPVVGALIGLLAGLAYGLAALAGLPPLAAALAAIAMAVLVTGALHEDGLADTADALGAGEDRERALAIMRDSRIGSFGTIAIVLVLLARATAMAVLTAPMLVGAALIAAGAASRSALPVVMLYQPSARTGGLAAGAGRPSEWRVGLGVGLALALALLVLPWAGALIASAALLVAASVLALVLGRRFGGCTGDTLGAVQQVAEVAFLMGLVAAR